MRITCDRHPDRPAFAVCMKCRQSCCAECSTEWDGVNLCFACLNQAGKTTASRSPLIAYGITTTAAAVAVFLLSRVMAWTLAFLGSVME